MADTFSQIYLQFVFAVKHRQNLIAKEHKEEVLISDFVKEIKVESNEFINNKNWINEHFNWQEGYGVFSYSHSHIDRVVKYILNQEKHHTRKTFRQEYHQLLDRFQITYEEKYVFEFFE